MSVSNWIEVFQHVEQATHRAPFYGSDSERVLTRIKNLERRNGELITSNAILNGRYESAYNELYALKEQTGKKKLKARIAALEEQVAEILSRLD